MSRRGFTMIELLMVIVVISVLSSLLLVGGMYVITSSREAATRSTLKIVKQIIADRELSITSFLQGHDDIDPFLVFDGMFSREVAGIYADQNLTQAERQAFVNRVDAVRNASFSRLSALDNADQRTKRNAALIEWKRILLPQTWAEADFQRCVKRLPPVGSTNPATENSEVLFFFLTTGKTAALMSVDADAEAITQERRSDTDGNGLEELIDGWGRPMRFWRWPARTMRPEGLPVGYLPRGYADMSMMINISPNFVPISNQAEVLAKIYMPGFETSPTDPTKSSGSVSSPYDSYSLIINFLTPDSDIIAMDCSSRVADMEQRFFLPSTYHTPIVVSAGLDGEFGLLNPISTTDFGYWGKVGNPIFAYDDITDR